MRRGITKEWSIDLDGDYARDIVDGNLRFKVPGRTIWLTVRNPTDDVLETLALIKEHARKSHPKDAEEFEELNGSEARYASWYSEPGTYAATQHSLYGYTIRPGTYVQSVFISDSHKDRDWALERWHSIRHDFAEPATAPAPPAAESTHGRKRAPDSGRAAARAAIAAFGGEPQIYAHYDADESHKVDILSCKDRPNPGLVSYSTLGVHVMPNVIDDDDFRVELSGIAEASVDAFPNLLSTAAFYVIKNRWHVAKGIVFPGLVRQYEMSKTMDHLMWVEPLEWDTLRSVDVGGGLNVHWVLAFPISESERQYLMDNGFWKLEALMVDREVDYWDVNRRPVV